MNLVSAKTLTTKSVSDLPKLVFICSDSIDIGLFIESGYTTFSLNAPLARFLIAKVDVASGQQVSDAVKTFFPTGKNVYLTDYEMLLDPRYNIDPLRLFQDISRTTNLAVKWCGNYENGLLTYAEPCYEDYKRYDLNQYKITCII